MDIAAYSPKKLQLLNQCSPRASARKRSLFPTNSPQSNDLGLISHLSSDSGSETYSPPLASPTLSITPNKNSPVKSVLRAVNYLQFGNTPNKICSKQSAKEVPFGKENMENYQFSARKTILQKDNFYDKFDTLLSDSLEGQEIVIQCELKRTDNLTTPKKSTVVANNKAVRRSPRSASKTETIIKPTSFYGNIAPVLATNQTNRIGGVKCVFRPATHQSRAKAKLVFDEKPAQKRERSKSIDVVREAKRRKTIFTGVHHSIPRPIKHNSPPVVDKKPETIREKARNITDLSRTPYGIKKQKDKEEGWNLRFTKPKRYEESTYLGEKRRFFKTSVRDSPEQVKWTVNGHDSTPVKSKKRKLLDTATNYLDGDILRQSKINASDIRELIEDDNDLMQDKTEMDDILLQLEEEDEEDKKKDAKKQTLEKEEAEKQVLDKKEAERQMLMNILEDSPVKAAAIDSLSDSTASLALSDVGSPRRCSRFSLEDNNRSQVTPRRMFSIFGNPTPGSSGSGKRKWRGVGEDQLQIDAGQKRFGALQCECGMIYQVGEAEDEMRHEAFHKNLSALRHTGWKNENVVGRFDLGYVIVITGDDSRAWQQKAFEVLSFVDKALGIVSDTPTVMHNQKVFLFIREKNIIGCMVASPVSRAYRMISSENDVEVCSEESYLVRCGISRMWTMFSNRRCGIATSLLDTVRRNFMYGYMLTKNEVAFSIPTPDGKRFAAKYMGSPRFFVYTGY